MNKKLSSRDQRVIDLLLDEAERPATTHGTTGYSQPDESVSGRVSGAEQLLGLLNLCEAEEPPADLVKRTLARIDDGFASFPSISPDRPDHLGPMA